MNTPNTSPEREKSTSAKVLPPWWIRAIIVAVGLGAWFWTQSLIGHRSFSGQCIGDGLHALTAPANQYLFDHPTAAKALLIVSSAFIDLFAIFLFGRTLFGPTDRRGQARTQVDPIPDAGLCDGGKAVVGCSTE